jgi:hypothetical protein
MIPSIIQIDDILVSSDIITEKFCCDYEKCKGACCIIGDSGAPLLEQECVLLEEEYDNYKDLMSQAGRDKVEDVGFFEIDQDGDIVTPLINGEECAFTRFEDGNCFCAVERAFCQGKCEWAKPISCRLYPIRVSTLSNGLTALNLHRWDICKDAFIKGRSEGIPVYKFLKDPITFQFGEEFYTQLEEVAKMVE